MFERPLQWIQNNLIYFGRPPWDNGVSPPELKTFLSLTDPGSVLDLGCGTGTNLITMAEYGWDVVGVDIAWLSVLRARAKLRKARVSARVIHGDITGNLNISERFDFILDVGCYHSLSPAGTQRYHENIQRWLMPGGTFLLYAHRRTSPGHSHGISSKDMEAFQRYLYLQWREDSREKRPDGSGGRPSTWMSFIKMTGLENC